MIDVGCQGIIIEVINERLKIRKNIFPQKFSEDFFFLEIAQRTVEKKRIQELFIKIRLNRGNMLTDKKTSNLLSSGMSP